eukprot:5662142-Heterocapsa_arctica.AAC.1
MGSTTSRRGTPRNGSPGPMFHRFCWVLQHHHQPPQKVKHRKLASKEARPAPLSCLRTPKSAYLHWQGRART